MNDKTTPGGRDSHTSGVENGALESSQEPHAKPDLTAAQREEIESREVDNLVDFIESSDDKEYKGLKRLGAPRSEPSTEVDKKEPSMLSETVQTVVMAFIIFLFVKGLIAEARYIPSSSMEPTLNINDRIFVEKLTGRFGRKVERGDVMVFYPPVIETGIPDNPWLQSIGGLPFLPEGPPVFVKRVVGLPGETVKIVHGKGVYINGQLLDENYVAEAPMYDLNVLGDIGGTSSSGQYIEPFEKSGEPIVVPEGQLFMMGDNRNHSADSHVWGFLDQKRIVGRSCLIFWQDKWLKFGG
ncbi:MAG: signal peptidase I [Candidatus Melainabacteria bacterium]|nr:signal peptidase I [Candidatus Melainabacteria bacterium]